MLSLITYQPGGVTKHGLLHRRLSLGLIDGILDELLLGLPYSILDGVTLGVSDGFLDGLLLGLPDG